MVLLMSEPKYIKINSLYSDSKATEAEKLAYNKNAALEMADSRASFEFLTAKVRAERRLRKRTWLSKLAGCFRN